MATNPGETADYRPLDRSNSQHVRAYLDYTEKNPLDYQAGVASHDDSQHAHDTPHKDEGGKGLDQRKPLQEERYRKDADDVAV